MKPYALAAYDLVTRPNQSIQQMLADSHDAWDSHGGKATAASADLLLRIITMFGDAPKDGYVNYVQPPQAPSNVLRLLGDKAEAARTFRDVWAFVVASGAAEILGHEDPLRDAELALLSDDYRGSGVFALAWLGRSALAQLLASATTDEENQALADELWLWAEGK